MTMNKIILIISLILSFNLFSQLTGTVTDKRDGKTYKTVKIGNQTWMAENLNVSAFRNGDPIPEVRSCEDWNNALNDKQPAWCYYENMVENGTKYGKLYNWFALTDPRGLAPIGWHIPSDQEWEQLGQYLGGSEVAGGKLKSFTNDWNNNGFGNNSANFSGLPGGYRNGDMVPEDCPFEYLGSKGIWWSSTMSKTIEQSYIRELNYDMNTLYKSQSIFNQDGISIRCLKDK